MPTIYLIPRLVQFGLSYSARSASAVDPFFTLGDGASNEGRRANHNRKSPLTPLSFTAFPMPASPVVPCGQVGSELHNQRKPFWFNSFVFCKLLPKKRIIRTGRTTVNFCEECLYDCIFISTMVRLEIPVRF